MKARISLVVVVLSVIAATPAGANQHRLTLWELRPRTTTPHVAPFPWKERWHVRTREQRLVRTAAETDASWHASVEGASGFAVPSCKKHGRDGLGRRLWRCTAFMFFADASADVEQCRWPIEVHDGRRWITPKSTRWVYAHCSILRNIVEPLGPEPAARYAPWPSAHAERRKHHP